MFIGKPFVKEAPNVMVFSYSQAVLHDSGVPRTKLVRAECVRCPWLLAQTKVATIFDIFPHGVVTLLPFTPEGIVVGF